jgi:hypothetical protein
MRPRTAFALAAVLAAVPLAAQQQAGAIPAGRYQCQVSAEYRFRPCTVTVGPSGVTTIDIPGGLLPLRGTLRAEGLDVILDGAPTDSIPFGCDAANQVGSQVGQIYGREGRIPLLHTANEACHRQRVVARLRKTAGRWSGAFSWNVYYNTYDYLPDETNRVTGFTIEAQRIPLTIRR